MEQQKSFEKDQTRREQYALTRPLAPEDIEPGMYVSVLRCVVDRWPSPFCDSASWTSGPVQHEVVPPFGSMPLRVVGVCLPFVMAQRPDGSHWTGDVRRARFGLLSDRFGAESFKRFASDAAREAKALRARPWMDDED